MQTATQELPKNIDWDALENGVVMPDNKKQVIIDFIRANGVPDHHAHLALQQPGGMVVEDTFESYLANDKYYSTGAFAKLANGTPMDFEYDTTDGLKKEIEKYKDQSHFDLGTFVHQAILEPHLWESVVCEPKANRASHEGLDTLIGFWSEHAPFPSEMPCTKTDEKKAVIAQMIDASGKTSIDGKNALIVNRLHERWMAYQNGIWASILASAIKEVSMYTEDYKGLPMRIRPDGLLFADQIGVNAVVSVKTTSATSVRKYARDCQSFGYGCKEAAYQKIASHITGLDFSTTIMIVLSTAEPFNVGVFILNDNEMRFENERFETAIELAKVCIQAGEFKGWDAYAGLDSMGMIDLNVY